MKIRGKPARQEPALKHNNGKNPGHGEARHRNCPNKENHHVWDLRQ